MTITRIPSSRVRKPWDTERIAAAPEPNDAQVWGLCRYLRNDCKGCPKWHTERGEQYKHGCRALAEEAARGVMAYATRPAPAGS